MSDPYGGLTSLTKAERFVNMMLIEDLLPELDPVFTQLALKNAPNLGFELFVPDEKNTYKEWSGHSIDAIVRVECWVEASKTYVYAAWSQEGVPGWVDAKWGERPGGRLDGPVNDLDHIVWRLQRERVDHSPSQLAQFHPGLRPLMEHTHTPSQPTLNESDPGAGHVFEATCTVCGRKGSVRLEQESFEWETP